MTPNPIAAASYGSLAVSSKPVASPGAAVSPAPAAAATVLHANPVSLLDPSTGLVVLEFYNAKGDETASLPTKKQLELYRQHATSPDVFEPAIRDLAQPPQSSPGGRAAPAASEALPKEA